VQGLVLVRDDFWMAATRFMANLEISLVQGQNCAAVDLFDPLHARKVLAEFGRAYGRLPDNLGQGSKDQGAFLDQAVAGLAQDDKVIPVRLALFAEMVKGQPWTPATLRAVGGTEGVGVTFLEETFAGSTAPPPHRRHQQAAQAVLRALLPAAGTDLKGHLRSHQELLQASGYASRPGDFDDLLRLLDGELRLLTPADPEGVQSERPGQQPPTGGRYYQLTHDYLVPSLRGWLTRKQKETRRGRAELLLEDRAGVWNARPEDRQLPSLWQWLAIRGRTRPKSWTPPQRKMMRQADRFHALRGLVFVVLLALLGWGVYEGRGRLQAYALLGRLQDAHTSEVPAIVQEMAPFRRWLDPLLHAAYAQAEAAPDLRKQLHASLALLPVDATQVEYLYGRLLDAGPHEIPVIRDALAAHQSELVDRLWAVVARPDKGHEKQRLRAAAALATYDPDSQRWEQGREPVANDLVRVPAVHLVSWMESFRPVRDKLLAPLAVVYRDTTRRETERSLATDLLADYAADQPPVLADLLMDADDTQFAVLYPTFKGQGEDGLRVLAAEVDRKLPPEAKNDAKERLAKRQANAAVVVLRMNQPAKVWPLLRHSPDPRLRSYLIHRFGPLGADAGALVQRLAEEPDATIRRALILSLGPEEFGKEAWTPEGKKLLEEQLKEMYRTAADPWLRAPAEWLLRQWKQEQWIRQVDDGWAKDQKLREETQNRIRQELAKKGQKAKPQWYVTGQGQTMVVIPGPVEFRMGSPPTEATRRPQEVLHRRRIGRAFAIAAKPVTKEQFLRFWPIPEQFYHSRMRFFPDPTCPIGGVRWHEAAAYCNWLSAQEGIPPDQWCYEISLDYQALQQKLLTLGIPPDQWYYEMSLVYKVAKMKDNYLSLTGYRLPTEAEWEYACRAGSVTSRFYGESEELLEKYCWYRQNAKDRSWPVGSKKPNDLGLFDMHGTVDNWCQEAEKDYPVKKEEATEDEDNDCVIDYTKERMTRGGSYGVEGRDVRSGHRVGLAPMVLSSGSGFRPARTFR
jgi:formylglycine-generating enzyme required for sulfatase activity